MYLIQILLPLYDNDGMRFPKDRYDEVRDEMIRRFGGLTAYARTPVSGLWQPAPGETLHDDLVIYEVMAETLDTRWWQEYRKDLEARFRQQELVVRAYPVQIL